MPTEIKPPLPPFTRETAILKVRAAEDGWNSCDPQRVSLAYSLDSKWRNRSEFVTGREQVVVDRFIGCNYGGCAGAAVGCQGSAR